MEYKIYRDHEAIKSDGEIEKMVAREVDEGWILEITHLSVSDITTAGKTLEIGYVDMGGIDRVICLNQNANIKHHHATGRLFLQAGEAPYGRVTTATDGDLCYFTVHGKLWKIS